jgi:pimeloyl-ACP methyl ester carboxylesterase
MHNQTFVLVHGAYHGGWCWKDLASLLRSQGHDVYTPTLTGLGEKSHLLWTRPTLGVFVEDIRQVIRYEELSQVILVGHSFGGLPITVLADQNPEFLRHIVYLDATVLRSGESAADRMPSALIEEYTRRGQLADGLSVTPNTPNYYDITDPAMAARLAKQLTPQPLQPYMERIKLSGPIGNGLPVTYIACTKPDRAVLTASRELAKSMPDWNYIELAAGHNAMMTAPDAVAEILTSLA